MDSNYESRLANSFGQTSGAKEGTSPKSHGPKSPSKRETYSDRFVANPLVASVAMLIFQIYSNPSFFKFAATKYATHLTIKGRK
jgi:hypothetical protein